MFLRLPFKRNTKSNGFTVQETTHESWITAIKDCSSILLTTPDFKQERFRDSLCTLVQIELLFRTRMWIEFKDLAELCVNATSLEHFAKELDRVEANIRNSVLIGTHEYDYMV
jgi:hypothetical protein